MWQAVDLFSDWLVRIPGQARLVHVGKGSTHETAAVLDCSKNRIELRGFTYCLGCARALSTRHTYSHGKWASGRSLVPVVKVIVYPLVPGNTPLLDSPQFRRPFPRLHSLARKVLTSTEYFGSIASLHERTNER
jgi:hypothetical protein